MDRYRELAFVLTVLGGIAPYVLLLIPRVYTSLSS
jgi:hypothetical protein